MSYFVEKKRMATELAISQTIGLSCVGPMLGHCQKYTRPTLPSWRLPCYRYGMICHKSSLVGLRQSCHFKRDLIFVRCCSWWTFWTHNIQFKYWEGSWHSSLKRLHCWRKSSAKCDSIFTEYLGRDCMFTWKTELEILNGCIYWSTWVILIKFAGCGLSPLQIL